MFKRLHGAKLVLNVQPVFIIESEKRDFMKHIGLTFLCLVLTNVLFSQNIQNKVFNNKIRTPLAFPEQNPVGYPMIELNSASGLEFHFDLFNDMREDYRYSVFHCDHDWNVSALNTSEYLTGFPWTEITDVEYSFNTQIEFIHYQWIFPNELCRPTRSGNYGVVVYKGDDPWKGLVLSYRVVIYENMIGINSAVVNSSIVGERFKKQEIDFSFNTAGYYMPSVQNDLHVVILQNGNWNNAIFNLKPTFIKPGELIYDHNGVNNFDGLNEWRAFEVKSTKFAGIQVNNIILEPDGWHVYLRQDLLKGTRAYQTDFDLNGRTFIKNDLADDTHLEAEYVYVHFSLSTPKISENKVFLVTSETDFTGLIDECAYNPETKAYDVKKLLKQGYYNYRFATINLFNVKGDYSFTEGSFMETENDYHIIAYYFDRSLGSDRIIGVSSVNSAGR